VTFFRPLIAAIFWAATSSAVAVSLGRSEGVALLGRPLAISILLALDGAEASTESCVSADVFYADSRLESSRVRVSLEKTSSGQEALIRIRTTVAVDEPVVTVQVRAGCTRSVERRYVLLADPVPRSSDASAEQADSSRGKITKELPGSDRPLTAASPVTGSVPAPVRPAAGRSRDAVSATIRSSPARLAAKPVARLKLEPLDLTLETSPQLKASSELSSLPEASAGQRAMAAALWKALMAEPEDVLREAEKISSIEADLKRLNSESKKNQLALADLQAQLQLQQRDARWWIGGLLAGLVLLVFGFFFWRAATAERTAPWWRRKKASDMHWLASELGGNAEVGRDSVPIDSDLLYSMPPDRNERAEQVPRPQRIVQKPASGFMSPSSRRSHTDFALSMPHVPRAVKAEELFDVQHQAEFFISIGQYEQAVAVLRNHISEDSLTSALVYLDLFNLYHQLKRRAEFDGLRVEFSRLFNAEIPPFDTYTEASLGLEAHGAVMARIVSLWPGPKVLEAIEEAVFREPGDRTEVFGLEAYRELLFLYGIAREIVQVLPAANSSLLDFDLPSLPVLDPEEASREIPAPETAAVPSVQFSPARKNDSGVAGLQNTLFQRGVDIDLGVLEMGTPFIAVAAPQDIPVAVKEASSHSSTAAAAAPKDFGEFNLIDFEISSLSSRQEGGKSKK
jgi:hypothetical protein